MTQFRGSDLPLRNSRAALRDAIKRVVWSRFSSFKSLSVLLLPLVLGGCHSGMLKEQNPDTIPTMDAELLGHDYRFYFRYPGDDGSLDTDDDRFGMRNLYVPEGAAIRLHLHSRDYIYTIEIPELDVYEVAVPDLSFDVRFVATTAGAHELLGSQMCGYDHPELLGKLVVQPAAEFRRTMQTLSKSPLTAP